MKRNIFMVLIVIVLSSFSLLSIHAQGVAESPIIRRNLTINLGDGLTTDAQLTLPNVGNGPFPGVLLIHGSGPIDMDAYIPPSAAPPRVTVRLFLQIAEYLSERGFAVLRYNKRGVGLNDTILDANVYGNMTFQDLVQDAEKAVELLRQQPEVDAMKISLIGHSEGTMIVPRIAIKDPSIRNIVLMSTAAHNLYDIVHWQIVRRNIQYAENLLDTNHDGLISIQEALEAQGRGELPAQSLVQNSTGHYEWYPGLDTNIDGYFNIHDEWEPILVQAFALITTSDPNSPLYDRWLQSQLTLKDTNLDLVGNVSTSILILQGENDIQLPVEEAFLLEQRLIEANHPDHTLITYPDLGHSFYPAKGLNQPLGPIQERVLSDLVMWIKDPVRNLRYLNAQTQIQESVITDLQIQVDQLNSSIGSQISELDSNMSNLERQISELQLALGMITNNTYVAIGVAIIAIAITVLIAACKHPKNTEETIKQH